MEMETQNYHVKAVVSLLQEARPFGTSKNLDENHRRTMQVLSVDDDDDDEVEDEATLNERRLLSRYTDHYFQMRIQTILGQTATK